jgi:ribonuclease R
MESKILRLLGQPGCQPANVAEMLHLLRLKAGQQQELQKTLDALCKKGLVVRTKGGRHILAAEADLIPGVIQITRGGRGFVQPEQAGLGEISIAENSTGTSLHGDRVLVRLNIRPMGLRKPGTEEDRSGEVVRVLERKRTRFVGTLQRGKKFLVVVPDDPRLPPAVHVPEPQDVGRPARMGDKVVVELAPWESRHAAPEGEIIEVLGAPDEQGVDMLSVLRHYALPLSFPKNVLAEANAIARSRPDNQPSPEECAGRTDCRGHLVITIDPDDARDFDDAICIQPHGKDQWRLWVHIADVSHYVRPGSALDVEARKRGNSTYLVDRVIPMLPEALSNELCSLKPDLDRLTKCVEFVLSDAGHVVSTKFYPPSSAPSAASPTRRPLPPCRSRPPMRSTRCCTTAHQMAQRVRRLRFKNGSLDLDFPENKIRLDEEGKVLRIERMENDASHQLIEEFMLLANEAVAARLMALNRPAVYRIHEPPKEKRLNDYRQEVLSHNVPCGNLSHRPEVQKLLARLAALPIGQALKIGFLKSLMRARYAAEPLGHYGLAKTKYTHFTSPIRRFADLVVHRALFDKVQLQHSDASEIAAHISLTEKNSSDAERDSKELKLYAFLESQIESKSPQTYTGLVTDVRNFGFFVDVPGIGLSGLVPLSAIAEDFFHFDPAASRLIGRRTRRIIRLGDELPVRIHKVDRFNKRVDFTLAESPDRADHPEGGPEPRRSGDNRRPNRGKDARRSPDAPPGKAEPQKRTKRRRKP